MKTKEQFFVALKNFLKMYDSLRLLAETDEKFKNHIGDPIDYQLEHYDDFYEWLLDEEELEDGDEENSKK